MNHGKVIFWSVTVALGGFLFGFDTAVISGAEGTIQQLWGLSEAMTGSMVASALWGTIIGALLGGMPADRFGRKRTLFWIAVLYFVSAAGSALSQSVWQLMFFRFIGGLGVGASSVVAPMYISEISPTGQRGRLTALFQFNIVLGILIAYFSNYLIGGGGDGNWRWMLGVEAFPAFAFVIMIGMVPRSPRWLVVKKGLIDEARKVLEIINPSTAEASLRAIQESHIEGPRVGLGQFFSKRYAVVIFLAFLIAMFNQLSGINAVIYYAPRIFASTGMGVDSALLSTTGIGLINLIFTLIGMSLIDKAGRKFLMYIGSFGYIFSLSVVSWAFYSGMAEGSYLVPIMLFLFIAAHAIGQGAVIWVFISEIFPNDVRSYGNSLGSGTHWVFAALIANVFPFFEKTFGGGPIFAFFAFMMVLQLLWVWKMMPETKNVSLEELEKRLIKE